MNLQEELNESQLKAVKYCDGPSLVIAGAGSGKTRVLTYKIAYLLEQGYKPRNILALTFTNKAAREMRTRIGRLVGEQQSSQLWMGTFHSIFARVLRIDGNLMGYLPNFTIYDESDSKSLLKRIIKEKGLDEKVYKPNSVMGRISEAKNKLILPERYAADRYALMRDEGAKMPEIHDIYTTYCNRCKIANAMDFDDLLLNTYYLFHNNPDICNYWAEKFDFVLVDEYQDTNYAQHQIVLQLTGKKQNVCVVGDDAQSIYSFRGANIDNILSFTKTYPNALTFKLERNYRSTKRIVAAANSLIKHNEYQIEKNVYSENQEGEALILKNAYSDREEAIIVCKDIQQLRRTKGYKYSDFAVLYRTNAQSRAFEEAMRKEMIPYRVYGGLSFYSRKEIKDVLAYFRLIANTADEEAFKRIINYPARGIGDTTIGKIITAANQYAVSLWDVAFNPQAYSLEVSSSVISKLKSFCQMIVGFTEASQSCDAYEVGRQIILSSGIKDDIYSGNDVEDVSRQENLEELLSSIQDFVATRREEGNATSIFEYLQEVSLITDLDSNKDADVPKVHLMTIHSAKGLEFPVVFIVGVEENIFPSPQSIYSLKALEEERRLFYVAITRAKHHCIITNAQNRWRFGKQEIDIPSRFLRDIDSRYISDGTKQYWNSENQGFRNLGTQKIWNSGTQGFRNLGTQKFRKLGNSETPESFRTVQTSQPHAQTPNSLQPGTIIEHERFGIGTVIRVEGQGENTKATVEFRNLGTKQLLLKFARFKIVKA